MDGIRLYLRSTRMLLKSHLQYPASFMMQTLAQLVMMSGELLVVLLVIDRFDSLNQWTGGDIMVFFGVMTVSFYLTEFFGRGLTGNFSALIRSGALDTFFLRPRGVLTQVLLSAMDPRRISCVAVGIAALWMGCARGRVEWTLLKAAALLEAILFGSLLILGLFMIEAIFAVHSVKSIEVVNVLTYGGRSACEYPIDIYPTPLRVVFTAVAPFSLTMHAPVSYFLGKTLFGWPDWTAFVCPLAGAAFFGIMYLLFRRALRFYRSTGS